MGRTTGHYCNCNKTIYESPMPMKALYLRDGNKYTSVGYICPRCNNVELNE